MTLARLLVILAIRLLSLIPYFGVGFLCYAHWVSDTINTGSAWFWAYLLAWPLILFFSFALYVVGFVIALAALFFGAVAIQHLYEQHQTKKRRKNFLAEKEARRTQRGQIIDL